MAGLTFALLIRNGRLSYCTSPENEHRHLSCFRCGQQARTHIMVDGKVEHAANDTGRHSDRVPACAACVSELDKMAALEGLSG